MSAVVIQLKPYQEFFYEVVRGKLTRLDALVLCEGSNDAEAAKRVLRKVEEGALLVGAEQLMVGFTDRGGKDNVPLLASGLLILSRLARKLKSVLVVVDAEECTADDRVRSLSDSLALKERGLGVQLKRFRKDSV